MDKKGFILVLILTLICIVAGGILAWVNSVTEPKIKAQAELALRKALQEVLPAASEFQEDQLLLEELQQAGFSELVGLFIGDQQSEKTGIVFIVKQRGYSSTIQMAVAVSMDGQFSGLKVISQAETPGLGVKITECEFVEQPAFQQASIDDQLKVKKDGGQVAEAVTSATISSRAVVRGVNKALAAARWLFEAKML